MSNSPIIVGSVLLLNTLSEIIILQENCFASTTTRPNACSKSGHYYCLAKKYGIPGIWHIDDRRDYLIFFETGSAF